MVVRACVALLCGLALTATALIGQQGTTSPQTSADSVQRPIEVAQSFGPFGNRYRRTTPQTNSSYNRDNMPRGRRYIDGRYYGNYNNRYYGPQYGYF
ncbi:MAG: hypothetical protein RIC12_00825 [Pirellulales bacterium]